MDRPAPTLPVVPASLRCFLGWDEHWDLAAHNLVRRNLPRAVPFIRGFEMLTRRTFPALRPGPGFDDHPIYYTGNHLTVVADGADVEWPSYSRVLDFELEFGAVVTRPIRDASEREAEASIGGYVVFDDISARDTQWEEQRRTPFGPVVKTKTFASSMGADVVTPDEVAAHVDSLAAAVRVNGELWSTTSTAGMRYSMGESLAFASRGESIYPGEPPDVGHPASRLWARTRPVDRSGRPSRTRYRTDRLRHQHHRCSLSPIGFRARCPTCRSTRPGTSRGTTRNRMHSDVFRLCCCPQSLRIRPVVSCNQHDNRTLRQIQAQSHESASKDNSPVTTNSKLWMDPARIPSTTSSSGGASAPVSTRRARSDRAS